MEQHDKPTGVEPPPPRYGDFEVCLKADGELHELGRGGMGITYKAFNRQFDNAVPVALKIILPPKVGSNDPTAGPNEVLNELLKFFKREAEAMASIDHTYVARAQQCGRTAEGVVYLAMDFVEGESLLQCLNQQRPRQLAATAALAIVEQVAKALRAIHGKDILHRDLKPSNIMLKRNIKADDYAEEVRQAGCLVKVIDFGLAKGMSGSSLDAVTESSARPMMLCTPHYASPEQLAGSSALRPSSDIYSLGAVFWEMVAGQPPHHEYSALTLRSVTCVERPLAVETLMRLPAPLQHLLKQMLAFSPENRPQSADELLRAIKRCRDALAPSGISPTVDAPPNVGKVVMGRYRIDVCWAQGDGGDLFRATDLTAQRSVALKWLAPLGATDGTTRLAELQAEWHKIAAHPHRSLLVHAPADLHVDPCRPTAPGYFVREWAAGIALMDLLGRWNALSAAELFRLLPALPGALDHAVRQDFRTAEVTLHKMIVVRSIPATAKAADEREWTPEDWKNLRDLPMERWPDLTIKYNPLGFYPSAADHGRLKHPREEVTRMRESPPLATAGAVRHLALLIRELLGASAASMSPIPALGGEKTNTVLRQAISGEGFGSCQEFWDALSKACESESLSAWDQPTKATVRANPRGKSNKSSESGASPLLPFFRSWKQLLSGVIVTLALAASGVFAAHAWWPAKKADAPGSALAPSAAVGPAGTTTIDLAKPYTNGLGMKFAPLPLASGGHLLMGCQETRVGDFGAVMSREPGAGQNFPIWQSLAGTWALSSGSWKKCGIDQSSSHPVVAVNLAEARRFCEVLTDVERKAGRLPLNLHYRLPDQAEWDAAINADALSARYPWGPNPPPPDGSGNYAGAEARTDDWPKDFAVIENYHDAFPRTAPVGSFPANRLGFFDLDGNVSEWCDYPKNDARQEFATRGGSWLSGDMTALTKQHVSWRAADYRAANLGFRCVLARE